MPAKFTLWALVPIFLFSVNALKAQRPAPIVIEGTVVADENGQAINGAHVYIVHGEEEALTNSKGGFRIESWQKLPIRLTVEYKNYRTTSITVNDPSRKQVLRLKVR